jgi:hypothetical protein
MQGGDRFAADCVLRQVACSPLFAWSLSGGLAGAKPPIVDAAQNVSRHRRIGGRGRAQEPKYWATGRRHLPNEFILALDLDRRCVRARYSRRSVRFRSIAVVKPEQGVANDPARKPPVRRSTRGNVGKFSYCDRTDPLLDHLVGGSQKRFRNRESERFGGVQIDSTTAS